MVTGEQFMTSRGARWTPGSKRLLFLGGQGVGSGIASTGGRGTSLLYSMAFTPFEKDPNDHDINTEAQAEAEAASTGGGGRGGRGGAGAAAVPTNVQVKIVWDGIERRRSEE